jgi:hypothetical protein
MRQHELATEEICDSLKKYFQINMVADYDISLKNGGENVDKEENQNVELELKNIRNESSDLPSGRLISLLQQAFAYQIALSKSTSSLKSAKKNSSIIDKDITRVESNNANNNENLIIAPTIKSNLPCVHRLVKDFKPISLPTSLMAILTANPRYKKVTHNHQEHINHGDIRCLSMIAKNDFVVNMSERENDDYKNGSMNMTDKEGGLIVVAGTDRGSLLLWSLLATGNIPSHKSQDRSRDGNNNHSSFNVSECPEIVPPSAFIQFKKGENVRVRRSYEDDDDDNELYPPKVHDYELYL